MAQLHEYFQTQNVGEYILVFKQYNYINNKLPTFFAVAPKDIIYAKKELIINPISINDNDKEDISIINPNNKAIF